MTTKKQRQRQIASVMGHKWSNRRWFEKWRTALADWKAEIAERHARIYEYSLFGVDTNRRGWCSLVVAMWSRNYRNSTAVAFWHNRIVLPQQEGAKEIASEKGRPDQWHRYMPVQSDPDWRFARRYRERFYVGSGTVGVELRFAILMGYTLDVSGLPEDEQAKMIDLIALIRKDTRNYTDAASKNRKELEHSILHRFNFRPRRKTAMEIVQVLDCVHGVCHAIPCYNKPQSGATYEFARPVVAMIYDSFCEGNRPDSRDELLWSEAKALAEHWTSRKERDDYEINMRKHDRALWPFVASTILLEKGWIDESEFMDRVVQHAAGIAGRKSYRNIWMPEMGTDPHAAKAMPKARNAKIGEFASEVAAEYLLRYYMRGVTSWIGATKGALRKMGRQWQGKPLETFGVSDGESSRVVSKREFTNLQGKVEEILTARRHACPERQPEGYRPATLHNLTQGGIFVDHSGHEVVYKALPAFQTVRETIRHLADAPMVNPHYLDPEEIVKYVELANLTRSERQVFELLQRGKTLKDIAFILDANPTTIRGFAHDASRKMQQTVAAA